MDARAVALVVLVAACGKPASSPEVPMTAPVATGHSFADDVAFLDAHAKTIILEDPSGGRVAVSPHYQGRVMTSAVSASGGSLGYVNRPFIEAGKVGTAFDNYGGEDRFWLGPEGGQFGLYFPPGKAFAFDLWQTPHPMQEGPWSVTDQGPDHVTFARTMTVTSWSKVDFVVEVERTVRLLTRADAKTQLALGGAPDGGFVAYETKNRIINKGPNAWSKATGVPSIWILAQLAPAADAKVVIPFEKTATGEVVNDRYFGKIPPERLAIHEDKGFLTLVCDGKQRGKIGLGPARAKSVLGSFSASSSLLTVISYDGPAKSPAAYVNSMWEQQKDPYAGDVVNSYNDGPTAPGKPALGGFYEIETSSPGAELAPGKDMVHTHRTFHFVGDRGKLDAIARDALGVSLTEL